MYVCVSVVSDTLVTLEKYVFLVWCAKMVLANDDLGTRLGGKESVHVYMYMYALSDLMVTPKKHVFQVWSAIATLAVGDVGAVLRFWKS